MRHPLIVFEGIDGVGKSSLARRLLRYLQQRGVPAVRYEDTEDPHAGFPLLKPFLKTHADTNTSLFFYLASSLYKSRRLDELLLRRWVLCDRYVYSTLAAHAARGADPKLIPALHHLPVRLPDFLFLLTVDEKVRMQRARRRKSAKPADRQPKRRGSVPWKMERKLRTFRPVIIDNSSSLTQTLRAVVRHMEKNGIRIPQKAVVRKHHRA